MHCKPIKKMDEELREELASIRNLLTEVLVNQDILSKKISADVAIQATQAERAVELNRLRQTASRATQKLRTN
jgi:hypothetical protein